MKFTLATTALLALASSSAAFAPSQSRSQQQRSYATTTTSTNTQLRATVVTGIQGKAASSREEDLMLTLQVIMDHADRSATVSKEQYVQQVEESLKAPSSASEASTEKVDISVPYDAAARLAFEASDKSTTFEEFEVQYLAQAVALVKSKQPQQKAVAMDNVDISVPYDATAKLAYEKSDKSLSFEQFKPKFLAEAVELVKSKQQPPPKPAAAKQQQQETSTAAAKDVVVDISIPYDAAAQLAYEQTDKSMPFANYKTQYLAEAVALVKSKQPVDLSIPYDAAAKLAYNASDRSMPFPEFEQKFKAEAVADVIAKQKK